MADARRTLTSIGVDVGTTTTHAIVSRLRVETPPGGAASPKITDREIVHRGTVRETPLLDSETIDVDRVAAFVDRELEATGVTADEIDTGAVIVTGETARRANAEPLVHRLAADSGQFVAAVAGASLEAVLAGRGSGAATRAAEAGGLVANVDVGGGTTNVAIFDGRDSARDRTGPGSDGVAVRETRCLDVGGRLVTFDDRRRVISVSPPARTLVEALELPIARGESPPADALDDLAAAMADRIVDLCAGPPFDDLTRALAIGPLPDESLEFDGVVFSGGVGRLVASPPDDPFAYGDLGGSLAAALADHAVVRSWPVLEPAEDIRATVVGAGTETTTLSGRTVSLEPSTLPLRNVPVAAVPDVSNCSDAALEGRFEAGVSRLLERHDPDEVDAVALSIDDVGPLAYDRLRAVGDALVPALESLSPSLPMVVVTRQNCAKVLGQVLRRRTDRPLLVLDELVVGDGDYLDVGEPMPGGESVPVVVKTLAFGE
ncbi:ethanolamine ammonia-lyase reactivating factor EutA [Natronorubrum texcoconense]|uniref:Reactivating factor of Adenosylcobalamin-dependent ethanolamine ammonia lyase n=1 Tax=Natronorubrum texcoconense TaxID=1095776 RepID=A0A1G9BVN6_9EURY|nr:ethanolamine ammonia-lyase reactivating factor EutA [Natronorubrum texcoconense]SDK43443.1 Reactivating factor of Adenosylcobalamin-dependent ethanolamine ammonia lyase [Natronorubrum texcoconense]